MNKIQKILSSAVVAGGMAGCDSVPRDPLSLAHVGNTVTRASGYPPFQIIDYTNDSCMNTVAFNALIFAFEDVAHDPDCSDGERNKKLLKNPSVKGQIRAFASELEREQVPYLEPSVPYKDCADKFGFYALAVVGATKATTDDTCLREDVAKVVNENPYSRPDMHALAINMYAERDEATKARILKAAWNVSTAVRENNRQFVSQYASSLSDSGCKIIARNADGSTEELCPPPKAARAQALRR